MIIIVMGVSGSGKSTIGQKLAERLQWQFSDADDFHSPANLAKMSQGIALTDEDRQPWLESLQGAIAHRLETHSNVVLACSLLKHSYRTLMVQDPHQIVLVYLKGPLTMIQQRLEQRQNHFMKAVLLQSQFEALEEPDNAILVDINQTPTAIVEEIITLLKLAE